MFDENTFQFLRNLYRKNEPSREPRPGMALLQLAQENVPLGGPVMSDDELALLVSAFETSGFTGGLNWYRNLDRNWQLLADADPIIHQPALMVYGDRDMVQRSETLRDFVPNVDIVTLDCGHWIQQERPAELNDAIVSWLQRKHASPLQ